MRKHFIFGFLLLSNLMLADTTCDDRFAPHCVDLGANYTRVNMYPKGHASYNGNLGGLQGKYEYKPNNWGYSGVQLAWRQGQLDSVGSAKRDFLDIDTWEHVGYTVGSDEDCWSVTFFSGFGWRYLGQTHRQPGQASVEFNYNEVYIPVGLSWNQWVNCWFALGFSGSWMPQVFSTVNIIPLGGARWIIQRSLVNFQVELPFTFSLYDQRAGTICIKPFFSFWRDGKSIAETSPEVVLLESGFIDIIPQLSLGLPQNTYLFYGLYIDWEYSF